MILPSSGSLVVCYSGVGPSCSKLGYATLERFLPLQFVLYPWAAHQRFANGPFRPNSIGGWLTNKLLPPLDLVLGRLSLQRY